MDYAAFISFLLFSLAAAPPSVFAQNQDIPYQYVEKICETCTCMNAKDQDNTHHFLLDCSNNNFTHILPKWPPEFGTNHNGVEIISIFSGNQIETLQQLPTTNASVSFSCRHCGITGIQAPVFIDVQNIVRLDLSWNALTGDALTPDVFRGRYSNTGYEPIGLRELDLSHNKICELDSLFFEHMPLVRKLNLGYNNLSALDAGTLLAISSVTKLEILDLSYNGLADVPFIIFRRLLNLKSLSLQGNKLKKIPADLNLLGKTLEYLNIAGNPMQSFSKETFTGLKVLKRLNISQMSDLATITNGTFAPLESLEYLLCSRNPNLNSFDVEGLITCKNLTYLDISHCNLETVNINVNLSAALPSDFTAQWPRLRTLEVVGNPWICDCKLLRIFEYCGSDVFKNDKLARCHSPFGLAGVPIANLTSAFVCDLPHELIVPDNEEPPKFLRRKYIVLTVVTIAFVIVIGLVIGYLTVCIRRRLRRDDFGITPIRYTSVRNSNLSAMSVTK